MSYVASILPRRDLTDPLRLGAPEPALAGGGVLAEVVDPLEQMAQAERADRGLLLVVAAAAAATLVLALLASLA